MREERLTERLLSWNKGQVRRQQIDPKKMTDSIVRHLERILNTRQGSVPIAADFGVPDFTDLRTGMADASRDLARMIRRTIQKYEPRLKTVQVKFGPQGEDPLSVSFQIVARLALDEQQEPVVFESHIDSDGRVKVRG
jgi:type VI secretion system protein